MRGRTTLVFADRYTDLGPPNGCAGPCEGTGVVPVTRAEQDPALALLWARAEAEHPSDDGWHFVACPDCNPEVLTPS